MRREEMLARLGEPFEVVVIGGGATGLGVAVDASSRGFRTCLVEAADFAAATSSRSTKLVHGGVRYLEQLDFALVSEALRERGRMHQNAPHLVHDLAFVVPRYRWWEGPFYGAGLKLYDALAGKRNLAPSRFLSYEDTVAAIPNVRLDGLDGGIEYHDGQFDDARMAVALARTAADRGAVLVTRMRAIGLTKTGTRVTGVRCRDELRGMEHELRARVVVNATGIFADEIRRLDEPSASSVVEPAQGIHLVLDRSFQPSATAIMVPHTDDGRVLFVIPWHDHVVVGTTDTPREEPLLEPRALPDEIEFVLRNAGRYLARQPSRSDVRSVFAGMRPLVHPAGRDAPTKSISRSHTVLAGDSGLVTIVGGKWTTYRAMAEDAMQVAIAVGGLEERSCVTADLHIHGYEREAPPSLSYSRRLYGTDREKIDAIERERPEWARKVHERLPATFGEAIFAAREEMALSLADVLARRTRCLFLDARAAMDAAPAVAQAIAPELGWDAAQAAREIDDFRALAAGYCLGPA